VTGVQTCALPIYTPCRKNGPKPARAFPGPERAGDSGTPLRSGLTEAAIPTDPSTGPASSDNGLLPGPDIRRKRTGGASSGTARPLLHSLAQVAGRGSPSASAASLALSASASTS